MAIKTDFRVTDDAENCDDLVLASQIDEDTDETVIILNQSGNEIVFPVRMLADLIEALGKYA